MRRQITWTVPADGPERDRGKRFLITEMPARQAERWAMRALLVLARSGVDLEGQRPGSGVRGLAVVGLNALLRANFDEAEPLLDEMMGCVRLKPDPNNDSLDRGLDDQDIEEVETLLLLRMEIFRLHVDFTQADAKLKSIFQTSPTSAS